MSAFAIAVKPISNGRPGSTRVDHGHPWSTMVGHDRPSNGRPCSAMADIIHPRRLWSPAVPSPSSLACDHVGAIPFKDSSVSEHQPPTVMYYCAGLAAIVDYARPWSTMAEHGKPRSVVNVHHAYIHIYTHICMCVYL